VSAALASLDAAPHVDVIVIARGGGSVEDLLPFSNEALLRAVAAARTAVVSAIGHESDSPLLDLVADLRASTPTDSARHLVPDVAEEVAGLRRVRERLINAWRSWLDAEASRLAALRNRPAMASPMAFLTEQRARVEELRRRARRAAQLVVTSAQTQLAHLRATARALSPAATMDRGYAVLTDPAGHALVSASTLTAGGQVVMLMHDGQAAATVTDVTISPTTADSDQAQAANSPCP
jgi:exodeoxyribonuclease VII large subunit